MVLETEKWSQICTLIALGNIDLFPLTQQIGHRSLGEEVCLFSPETTTEDGQAYVMEFVEFLMREVSC